MWGFTKSSSPKSELFTSNYLTLLSKLNLNRLLNITRSCGFSHGLIIALRSVFLHWWQMHRIHFKTTPITKTVSGWLAQESAVTSCRDPACGKVPMAWVGEVRPQLRPHCSNKILSSCPERATSGKRGLCDCSALSTLCFLWLYHPLTVPWTSRAIRFHGAWNNPE